MGYNTVYTVEVEIDGESRELPPEMLTVLAGLAGFLPGNLGGADSYFSGQDEMKWYEYNEHMKVLSAQFSNHTFRIEGVGDERDDHWVRWYFGGGCTGVWTTPEVDVPVTCPADDGQAKAKPARFAINAVAYITNNGDGSSTTTIFNDLDALSRELVHLGKTLEQVQSENDPYEDGQIDSRVTIQIEVADGVARLVVPIRSSN